MRSPLGGHNCKVSVVRSRYFKVRVSEGQVLSVCEEMAITIGSTHCQCYNFKVIFQFAHRIYQGQKFVVGARSGPV